MRVTRDAMYLGEGEGTLFGWHHHASDAAPRDVVAVICPPIGPEYTRTHRTLRHLADRLARAGIESLRFDFQGVGDSAGAETDPGRVDHWRRSIGTAVREARLRSGCRRACLVGLRLGATLAALEAEDAGVDLLVLWNPVVKGRVFARELHAMAMTARDAGENTGDGGDGIDSAGFRVDAQTLEALRALNLAEARFNAGSRVLLAARDDLPGDEAFAGQLAAAGVEHQRVSLEGWIGMTADHQFTVVPDEALTTIGSWVLGQSRPRTARSEVPVAAPRTVLRQEGFEEELCHFGAAGHLFGILTRPTVVQDKPAVIMLNAGSIHHVGPHRLYVGLARSLAAAGHASLRLDHEGLGDSVLRGAGRENHPYPQSALADVDAAIELLQRRGHRRFVLLGLCAGAHTAFHAGRESSAAIERLVLINPFHFYFTEGMPLHTHSLNHFEDVAAYQRSLRDPARWKKLLRGEVSLARIARVAGAHVTKVVRGRWQGFKEVLVPASGTRLSRDLRSLTDGGRRVTMYICEGEPAASMLATEAPRAVRRATRAGKLNIQNVPGGDHTFSRHAPREELIRRIRTSL